MPAVDPTRISDPSPASCWRKPRAVRKVAVRLASRVLRQRSSGSSQTGKSSGGHAPATAAQTSSAPDSANIRSTSASWVRSAPTTRVEPPNSAASASARSRPSWKCTTSRAPSAANARAHAEPMPPEPPVTSTRFPFSPVSICGILSVVERERMTWDDLGSAVEDLTSQIHADGFSPDAVLALARGGLPAAGALAYALGVKNMATLNVEFYTGVDERLEEPLLLMERLLVVDDVADTGRTLALARDFCAEHVGDVRTAVLYEKPQSVVRADFVWRRTEKWINFPWSTPAAVTAE